MGARGFDENPPERKRCATRAIFAARRRRLRASVPAMGAGVRSLQCPPRQMSGTVGPIERFLVEDHARIDRLLAASERSDGTIDEGAYARLRHDLLRHIGMEEKVLLPRARALRGGEPLDLAGRLRKDHGEIAKILVGSPTNARIATLRAMLVRHNALEEGATGLYAACDELVGDQAGAVVELLRAQPPVPVAPYYDGPPHRAR